MCQHQFAIKRLFVLLIFFTISPFYAFADGGIPMIFLGYPFILAVFFCVCAIETWFYIRSLQIKTAELVLPVILANLASTVLGYPIAWILLFGLQALNTRGYDLGFSYIWMKILAITLQSSWPSESEMHWMNPIVGMVGLIPTYFLSVWIEFLVLKKFSFGKSKIPKKAVWRANLFSYAFLFVILAAKLMNSLLSAFSR